jgi:putative ABC transport system permease protein
MRQGMPRALTGSAAGLAGAFLMARLMTGVLYGVKPTDPVTFGAVAAVLSLVSGSGGDLRSARKATRIAPAVRCGVNRNRGTPGGS